MNIETASAKLLDLINRVSNAQRSGANYLMAVCPWHPDNNPSLSIYVGPPGKHGWGNSRCLGCGKRADLKELAQKLKIDGAFGSFNLKHIVQETIPEISVEVSTSLLGSETRSSLRDVLKQSRIINSTAWPARRPWRGVPGKLVKELGGLLAIRETTNKYRYEVLFLPVELDGELYGGISAKMKRGKPSYLFSPGSWTKRYGLFPYEYTKRLLKTTSTVVIVEGVRDAIRLIASSIPALAVLGTGNISSKKAAIVAAMDNVENVILLGDGDTAGRKMNAEFYRLLANQINVREMKLPINEDKLDPGNMPGSYLKVLKGYL